jgi:hypothetical protein
MKKRDARLGDQLAAGLSNHAKRRPLPGVAGAVERACLIEQLVESVRRVQYPAAIRERDVWDARADPTNDAFDPIKAAVLHARRGNTDEAFWLVFLFVHFGKNSKSEYRLLRDVYAGPGAFWTWQRLNVDVTGFKTWLAAQIKRWAKDNVHRGFGAHRGHEKLNEIDKTVETYVAWVAPPRSHVQLLEDAVNRSGGDPGKAFDDLYRGMHVHRFGRLAKFDYLAMLGKLGLADIEAPSTYVLEGTGPLAGARLLYCGDKQKKDSDKQLDNWLVELGKDLEVNQQVVEDALCNWQKSPAKFRMFRG